MIKNIIVVEGANRAELKGISDSLLNENIENILIPREIQIYKLNVDRVCGVVSDLTDVTDDAVLEAIKGESFRVMSPKTAKEIENMAKPTSLKEDD